MKGYELVDKWLEEIYQKDIEWYENIRKQYNKIQNDYPKLSESEMIFSKEPRIAFRKSQEWMYQNTPKWMYGLINSPDEVHKVFKKDLEIRKQRLITKIEDKAGDILSAELRRNANGGLDGVVQGTKGKVYLNTHGAGGYNIQRFHFRTRIS